jgi:tripartite-type tricarboxylate transporter receptor subunit TctC
MFPERTVTLVVPFGKDGASDRLARAVCTRLAQRWGVAVETDNLPGDGSVAGMAQAARSRADGHTLLFGTSTTHGIAPALRLDMPCDPLTDFAPLALIGWAPNLMLARPGLAQSVAEVIALARRKPGQLRYASAGAGQTIHLCAALFAAQAGIELTHVPYAAGSMAGLADLMAGHVDLMFDNALAALPHVRAHRVEPLAVAATLALPELPGVPTLDEAGVEGCAADIWMGLFAPRATPPALLATLQSDLAVVLGQTDLIFELRAAGLMLDVQQGEAFAEEIRANARAWRAIIATCAIVPA